MTGKQIIEKCPISEKCKEFEDCEIQNILHQLKRKEQECERLKSDYFTVIQQRNLAERQLDQLKAELQATKGLVTVGNKQFMQDIEKIEKLEAENEELKKGLNLILTVQKNYKECPHQKLDVDVLVCDLDCATAFKKIAKQTLKKLENKNV